ncbi:MAG TPA: NAD(P)-dependent oxidoreductase [Candidatus Acidoferrales bacterium]|nr:NAD(P)-dependent oxidoreductase [Candidatus Acidoferrales bacterium]
MRVGIAGLGKMGSALAEHLLGSGCDVTVWDRTRDRIEAVTARGAHAAASPEALVQGMDAVIAMLWDDGAAREITLAQIIPSASPPTIVIEMSTLSPGMYKTLGEAAGRKGLGFLASPVLGSVDLARSGKLIALASGAEETFTRAKPLLEMLASTVTYVGPTGSSAYLKLANNAIIGVVAETLHELLKFCTRAGIDEGVAIDSLTAAFGRNASAKVQQLHAHDTAPRFSLGALYKDLQLARDAGVSIDAPLPLLDVILPAVRRGVERGLADRDYISLVFTDATDEGRVIPERAKIES